jgi:iron complex outermembrane recepter protein
MAGRQTARLGLLVLCVAGISLLADTTADRGGTHNFNIDSQPLASALQEFAKQGDVQVIFFSELVDGLTAHEIRGHYTLTAALDLLLVDSGLTYRFINSMTIEIHESVPRSHSNDFLKPM